MSPNPSTPTKSGGKPVPCPICHFKNPPENTFSCPACGRKNICLHHADPATGSCEQCATTGFENRELNRKAGLEGRILLPGGAVMEMVWCPPGTFLMGSTAGESCWTNDQEESIRKDSEFLHRVELTRGFWMAKYPVTQAQWKSVMGTDIKEQREKHEKCYALGGTAGEGPDCPMSCVTWEECNEFCRRAGLSLPTEAQWEYACRAGSQTPETPRNLNGGLWEGWDRNRPQSAESRKFDQNDDDFGMELPCDPRTMPVGRLKPNAWGLHDMHGNVHEWCRDWDAPYPSGPVEDPDGPASGTVRIMRGGSVCDNVFLCRSSFRNQANPSSASETTGFRPVKIPFGLPPPRRKKRKSQKEPSLFVRIFGAIVGIAFWTLVGSWLWHSCHG